MADQRSTATRGYLYALLGAICSGSFPTLVKVMLNTQGPVVLSGVGILLSGFVLLLYKPRQVPQKQSIPYLLYIGIVGAGIAPVLYTIGLNETTAVNAALLANGEVLFTTIIAFVLFGERLGRGQVYVGLLIIAGILVVTTGLDFGSVQMQQGLAGNLLILLATVGWGLENNLIVAATKRGFGAGLLSKFRNLIGGGLVTAYLLVVGFSVNLSGNNLWLFIFLVLDLAGVTFLFIAALEKLGAIRMILIYSLATVFGAFFALIFLGEGLTIAQFAGGAMIILGIFLFRKTEKPGFVV